MIYPNISRQSSSLVNRLSRLIVIKNNFEALANNSQVISIDELRHNATNYDYIRRPEVLNKYVNELVDYDYSLEYLQTFVKNMANSYIANRLLFLKKDQESKFQYKLSEKSSECEALKTEMEHLDLLIKEAQKQILADQARITELEQTVEEQQVTINNLQTETDALTTEVTAQRVDIDKLLNALETERIELRNQALEHRVVLEKQAVEHRVVLEKQAVEHRKELTKITLEHQEEIKQLVAKHRLEIKQQLEAQAKFFNAEIAELRGRLDNLEVQMRALQTDVSKLEDKVKVLTIPVSSETKQSIVQDLANTVALAYATVSNLQLTDPLYEQRRHWLQLLKNLWKTTKKLPAFGFNVSQHLDFIRLLVKANPC